jgi:hypothetical protein
MTLIGQNIVDYFIKSLDSKRLKTNKRILTERDSLILKRYYDFEENHFPTLEEIGQNFDVSRERIRQLHNRSLKKLKYAGKQIDSNSSSFKLISTLNEGVESSSGENKYLKLINFWHENLPEFPGEKMVKLFSKLIHSKKNEVTENYAVFKQWKKERIKKEKQEQLKKYREEKNKLKIDELQNSILNDIVWFEKRKKWKKVNYSELKPKRKVNNNSDFICGVFESKKCQREIQYESGLELRFILLLERLPIVKYYFEQPVKIEYQKNNKAANYTPDFAIFLDNNEAVIAEIKDLNGMTDMRVQSKIEVLIEYCKNHGFGLLLTNGFKTINYLTTKSCNVEFERKILKKLNENGGRTMFFNEFKEIQNKYNVQRIDFLSTVIKNDLALYHFPFKLTLKNSNIQFRKTMIKTTYNKSYM